MKAAQRLFHHMVLFKVTVYTAHTLELLSFTSESPWEEPQHICTTDNVSLKFHNFITVFFK